MRDQSGTGRGVTASAKAAQGAPIPVLVERLAAAGLDAANLLAWLVGGMLGIAIGAGILVALVG